MAPLPTVDIARVATRAGFEGQALITAIAVALAESAGEIDAHNTKGRDNSYGLWQINMYGDLGPARYKQFGLRTYEDLFDPLTNARAAFAISGGGTNWQPWSVYKDGTYRQYLDEAETAAGFERKGIPGLIATPFTSAADAVGDQVQKAIGALADPFVKGLTRLALIGISVATGVALIVAGAWRSVRASG